MDSHFFCLLFSFFCHCSLLPFFVFYFCSLRCRFFLFLNLVLSSPACSLSSLPFAFASFLAAVSTCELLFSWISLYCLTSSALNDVFYASVELMITRKERSGKGRETKERERRSRRERRSKTTPAFAVFFFFFPLDEKNSEGKRRAERGGSSDIGNLALREVFFFSTWWCRYNIAMVWNSLSFLIVIHFLFLRVFLCVLHFFQSNERNFIQGWLSSFILVSFCNAKIRNK